MKKIYLLLLAALTCLAANADTWVNVQGDYNGWNDNGAQPDSEGIATISNVALGIGAFKIKVWDGSDHWYSNGSEVATDEWIALGTADANMTVKDATKDSIYNVKFNVNTNELYLEPVVDAVISYDLWGTLTTDAWASTTLNENGNVWVSDEVTVSKEAQFGIRILTNGSQTDWLSAVSTNATIDAVGTYPLTTSGSNFTIASGVYTFTFDPEAMTLTVAGTVEGEIVIDYSAYWVNIGGDFTSWDYSANYAQSNEDGLATLTNVALGASTFNIKVWNGSTNIYYNNNGAAVALDQWTPLVAGDGNMTAANGVEGNVYTVEFNIPTAEIRLTLTGTTGLESVSVEAQAVEYFNLQGMRVENPSNGIFIRRQGSSVSKVAL